MQKKVLVTGAGGYIGRHVVKELLEREAIVFAADIKFDGLDERAVKLKTDIFSANKNIYENWASRMYVFIWHGEMDLCIILRGIF